MQIVIVSDTHSQNEILEYLEKKYKDAYAYIHCGDLEDDPRFYPNWLIVKGNNDYYGKFREDFRIRVGSHRIYVTHSHRCSYCPHVVHLHASQWGFKLCWACHQCILSIYCTCCKWNRDDAAFSKGSEKRCVYY